MTTRQSRSLRIIPILLFFLPVGLRATTLFIDFEGLPDSTIVTNQYPGLIFTNAILLTAGISLNEFEFPPHSGVNVVSDNGGPLSISFASPIVSFSGYFTYGELLTLAAFDSLGTQVASATSLFSNNEALSGVPGSSPNEFLQLSFAGGISSITITGDPLGGSLVMDDITLQSDSSVPEPSSLALFLMGALGLRVLRRRFLL